MANLSFANVSSSANKSDGTEYPFVFNSEWVLYSMVFLVNADFKRWFVYVFDYGINGALCLVGVVNNIITIIVFANMGFKETTNITMTAIAFWDLIKNGILGAYRLRAVSHYFPLAAEKSYHAMSYFLFKPISNIATHASSMLAVYVALERCLCVSMPFTVRFLLTRKTAIVSCLAVSAFVFSTFAMDFFAYSLVMETDDKNLTFVSRKETTFVIYNYDLWADYIGGLNTVYPIVTFGMTSACTIIIVYHLQRSSKFRSGNMKEGSKQMTSRERKTTKMLVVILIFYIIYVVPWISYYNINRVLMKKAYFFILDLPWFMYQIALFFSLLNSSVNLFVFYAMSTEFKRTLRRLFHLSSGQTNPTSFASETGTSRTIIL